MLGVAFGGEDPQWARRVTYPSSRELSPSKFKSKTKKKERTHQTNPSVPQQRKTPPPPITHPLLSSSTVLSNTMLLPSISDHALLHSEAHNFFFGKSARHIHNTFFTVKIRHCHHHHRHEYPNQPQRCRHPIQSLPRTQVARDGIRGRCRQQRIDP